MTTQHRHILVVDDEPQITRVLRTSLSAQGYDIRVANDGETALEICKDWSPDLVITDLMMPHMDGLELCRRLRTKSQVPIIVLSVKGEERAKVQALDVGADDYVTKPFGVDELLARMRAAVRRSSAAEDQPKIALGDLTVDLAAKRITRDGLPGDAGIRLTPTEWHLLEALLRNPGKLLSQRQLLHDVWGPGYDNAAGNLRLYMAQLRRKIEPDPARPRWLITEPGMGYRFQPPEAAGLS